MFLHQGVEYVALVGTERVLFNEYVAERLGLILYPGVHGGDEGVAAEEVHLQGQNAEEQIAVGVGGGHGGVLWA
jgi:hypothetical protein